MTRAMRSLLFDVSPLDATSFIVLRRVLFVCAVAAAYNPARRAAPDETVTPLTTAHQQFSIAARDADKAGRWSTNYTNHQISPLWNGSA